MIVTRYVIRRKSDGLYNMSVNGWTPDITQAALFVDEHLAHMMFDEIKDVISVRVTIEEVKLSLTAKDGLRKWRCQCDSSILLLERDEPHKCVDGDCDCEPSEWIEESPAKGDSGPQDNQSLTGDK
jgi:hypothetical protein